MCVGHMPRGCGETVGFRHFAILGAGYEGLVYSARDSGYSGVLGRCRARAMSCLEDLGLWSFVMLVVLSLLATGLVCGAAGLDRFPGT